MAGEASQATDRFADARSAKQAEDEQRDSYILRRWHALAGTTSTPREAREIIAREVRAGEHLGDRFDSELVFWEQQVAEYERAVVRLQQNPQPARPGWELYPVKVSPLSRPDPRAVAAQFEAAVRRLEKARSLLVEIRQAKAAMAAGKFTGSRADHKSIYNVLRRLNAI